MRGSSGRNLPAWARRISACSIATACSSAGNDQLRLGVAQRLRQDARKGAARAPEVELVETMEMTRRRQRVVDRRQRADPQPRRRRRRRAGAAAPSVRPRWRRSTGRPSPPASHSARAPPPAFAARGGSRRGTTSAEGAEEGRLGDQHDESDRKRTELGGRRQRENQDGGEAKLPAQFDLRSPDRLQHLRCRGGERPRERGETDDHQDGDRGRAIFPRTPAARRSARRAGEAGFGRLRRGRREFGRGRTSELSERRAVVSSEYAKRRRRSPGEGPWRRGKRRRDYSNG